MNRRPWHDRVYDRIWETCQRLDVAICFHGGGRNYLKPDYSLEVFDTLMMWHTFGQPLGVMAVAVSLTSGMVLQRFPKLRVGLLEGNCGWAPWLFHRLDEHWEWMGDREAPDLDRPPSEFFRSNCFVSVEADETPVQYYVAEYGDDNVVFSTDYPHGDSKFPHSVTGFLEMPGARRGVEAQDAVGQLVPSLRPAGRHRGRVRPGGDHRGQLVRSGVMPIDPRLQPVVDLMNAQPPADDTGVPIEELRARAHAGMELSFLAMGEPGPDVASIVEHRIPVGAEGVEPGEITVRVYTPFGEGPFPGHLYLHGGGFWLGAPVALRRPVPGDRGRAPGAWWRRSTTGSRPSSSSPLRPRTATRRCCGSSTTPTT